MHCQAVNVANENTKNALSFPKASLFHFQGASKRTERDQLSDDRQYQIKQRTKLELDMKDLKDIVDDDSSVKVSPANRGPSLVLAQL